MVDRGGIALHHQIAKQVLRIRNSGTPITDDPDLGSVGQPQSITPTLMSPTDVQSLFLNEPRYVR